MRSSKFLRTLALACATIALGMAISAQAQTLNYFANFDGKNGWEPYGSVTQATDGNFYGTTGGGINGVYGNDNVFRMTPSGEISSIYNFGSQPNCTNGTLPFTAPILGSDGNFYGATGFGGTASYGTIFKISPTGKYQVLYSFCSQANCTDGEGADFPPIQGRDGNFYGTTGAGGTLGAGVFYELTASGVYKVLHNFCGYFNCPVGEYSYAYTITQGANGNFYGTTDAGVFELTSTGQYTALAKFAGEPSTMGWPGTPLILASDGNFYGTFIGGSSGSWAPYATGGIYEITPQGELKALYGFCRGCDSTGSTTQGFTPLDQVFQGTDGNFYGTTAYGGIGGGKGGAGDWGFGTVFQFSNGLSPLVETVPVAGKAGQSVIILGYGLSGTTGVTFNGIAAEFTVESDTHIRATVPAGATTGMVSVDTPAGTLNSNPQFVVTQ